MAKGREARGAMTLLAIWEFCLCLLCAPLVLAMLGLEAHTEAVASAALLLPS